MKWVTREKARVDRIACPWLIKRFIDREATFLFVPTSEVKTVAEHEVPSPSTCLASSWATTASGARLKNHQRVWVALSTARVACHDFSATPAPRPGTSPRRSERLVLVPLPSGRSAPSLVRCHQVLSGCRWYPSYRALDGR